MRLTILQILTLTAITSCILGASTFKSWQDENATLLNYYNSGAYYEDISGTMKEATHYLQFRLTQNNRTLHPRKLAVVMDIDETALSNFHKLKRCNFHPNAEQLAKIEADGEDPAIPYTLAFYNYAKQHHVAIFFITGRPVSLSTSTLTNLQRVGYEHWEHITFNPGNTHGMATVPYRVHARQFVKQAGYDIVMNIGNREETLAGGESDMTFKLPNPFY